ncbi:hypothetical protein GCM10020358_48350 [Amorphoplanes nipponensis]|uniref:Uncharacterized protein n=1 Tax=Actinoplanes nipponensis TaxID=135950 RepID=A0A919JMX7_9ACTN|nr:hypothetical protein [Actinoplanes nipponensis]GIE52568.1 hypothetical protein Ani05nite_61020 [Actinoplanes nipponensis]
MERGPLALFGAIVAIGLGPAMWLGAQFGQVTLSPDRPPAVTTVQNEVEAPRGGSGAGDAPAGTETIRSEPKADTQPLTRTKNARPAATRSASPSPSESSASTPPTEPTSPGTSGPGDGQTTPPTESTTSPDDPPPPDDGPDDPPPTDPQGDPAPGSQDSGAPSTSLV